jgi:hypothetical protein
MPVKERVRREAAACRRFFAIKMLALGFDAGALTLF